MNNNYYLKKIIEKSEPAITFGAYSWQSNIVKYEIIFLIKCNNSLVLFKFISINHKIKYIYDLW